MSSVQREAQLFFTQKEEISCPDPQIIHDALLEKFSNYRCKVRCANPSRDATVEFPVANKNTAIVGR